MSDKNPMSPLLKLKDNHPTMVKLYKLYDLAEELGIGISFDRYQTVITDSARDSNLPPLLLQEIDGAESVKEWPPLFEYKVVFQNPEWLAKDDAEKEQRALARKNDFAKQEAERKAKEDAARLAKLQEQELKERAELARLKNKYGE